MSLKIGEWVSVKAEVVREDGDIVVLMRRLPSGGWRNFEVRHDQIDRIIPTPTPDEPDRTSILSDKAGRLYTYRVSNSTPTETGWCHNGRFEFYGWSKLYEKFGPFDVFTPDRKV